MMKSNDFVFDLLTLEALLVCVKAPEVGCVEAFLTADRKAVHVGSKAAATTREGR